MTLDYVEIIIKQSNIHGRQSVTITPSGIHFAASKITGYQTSISAQSY